MCLLLPVVLVGVDQVAAEVRALTLVKNFFSMLATLLLP